MIFFILLFGVHQLFCYVVCEYLHNVDEAASYLPLFCYRPVSLTQCIYHNLTKFQLFQGEIKRKKLENQFIVLAILQHFALGKYEKFVAEIHKLFKPFCLLSIKRPKLGSKLG